MKGIEPHRIYQYIRTRTRAFSRLSFTRKHVRYALFGAGVIAAVTVSFAASPPRDFPTTRMVTVSEGESLSAIASDLTSRSVIRSALLFEIAIQVFGDERAVNAGSYFFSEPQSVFSVASRIAHGEYGLDPIRVTLPEGATVFEMAGILSQKLPEFNKEQFIAEAQDYEGYLFPDTYYFLPTATTEKVLTTLRETFEEKTAPLKARLKDSPYMFERIVIMASLVEEEAQTTEDKQKVASVLWERIEEGMPLQVDAVFPYINGKNTYELTHEDLNIDSPYNTYRYKGLPPGPISNPGLISLEAAAFPTSTPYRYYLSDRSGNMYYAETFEGHQENRVRHLGQ